MARINRIASARASKRERRCDFTDCAHETRVIQVGEPYMWVQQNRYAPRKFRHADHPSWRPSETDTTKMASAYAAQEQASDALDAIDTNAYIDTESEVETYADRFNAETVENDVREILQDCASGAEDTINDYQEGIDALPDSLRDSSPTAEAAQERIDALEAWRDELESWSTSETFDVEGLDDEDEIDEAFSAYVEALVDEARDVVDGLEA